MVGYLKKKYFLQFFRIKKEKNWKGFFFKAFQIGVFFFFFLIIKWAIRTVNKRLVNFSRNIFSNFRNKERKNYFFLFVLGMKKFFYGFSRPVLFFPVFLWVLFIVPEVPVIQDHPR